MAVKAKAEITLATIRDVQSVTRYYLLQSSTSSIPSKPTTNPPGGSWVKTEPSYTSGSTNSLYFTDLTVFTDDSFSYSDVSLSSSYEAAKAAYNRAVAAQESVDGLQIGGRNLLLGTAQAHSSVASDPQYTTIYSLSDYGKSLFNNTETEFTLSFDYEITGDYSEASNNSRIYAIINATAASPANVIYVKNAPPTGHYETTCRLTEAQVSSTASYCRGRWNGIVDGCTLTVRNFKVELGNKATDWTPAPEDLQAGINLAQESIDNLKIGGRNYFAISKAIDGYINSAGNIHANDNDKEYTSDFIPVTEGEKWSLTTITTGTDAPWICYAFFNSEKAFVSPRTAGNVSSFIGFTVPANVAYMRASYRTNNYRSKCKLEKGNRATDWTPAPEDVDASVSAVETLASTALAQSVEYIVGTQTEATGSWTGVSMDTALYTGKTIAYKLPYAGSGNASLTLTLADGTATDAVPVYMNNTRVTTHYPQYTVIKMTYDGEAWRTDNYYTNSNNYDRRLHNSAIKAAAAVTKAHLIAGTEAGYKNFAASLAFDLAYPILYASAAISANATAKTAYEAYPDVNFSTTGTIESGTAAKILWLKGTVEANTFTIAASNWLTTVVPTEEDGMYYIPLGVMSSTTAGYFATSDRLYAFVDGAFQPLDNASRKLAEKAREEVVDAEERVRTYAESAVSQKADEIEISISTVTGTLAAGIQDCQESIAQTDEALNDSVDTLTQRISDQEDALLDYKHETSTYFRFNTDGLNIGKQEDGDESPYSINIDNEKMGFLQNGVEIAYVQYNKMHINAIEAMDRLSVGAAADGGYFDFISTEYGMGVKWRAVNQSNGASLNMMRAGMKVMAKKAAEYEAVHDEDGVFKVDFGGEK